MEMGDGGGEEPTPSPGDSNACAEEGPGPGEQGQCWQGQYVASPAPGHYAAIAKKLSDDAEQDTTIDVTVAWTG